MVRPIYAHEMCDPDFSWLISTFRDNNPDYMTVESTCLPVVLINFANSEKIEIKEEFEKSEFEEINSPKALDNSDKAS
ncbi:MAG: hypothetical protein GYA55_08660 [SAR324 cluster bacterium]|uniref:Uncharacterized protein n=1 Tax=SAR324 cluster bacterium TaxID=2024889 RepID=A0A7X9FRY6_9DELT|nr:hypothetical protein [SAR324 cluster bacterium]